MIRGRRCAPQASAITSSSIRLSLTGGQVDCTTIRIAAANVLENLDANFAVAEAAHLDLAQRQREMTGDTVGEFRVSVPGEHRHVRNLQLLLHVFNSASVRIWWQIGWGGRIRTCE